MDGGGGGGGDVGDRDPKEPDSESTYIIREIYENENSIETFLIQLERALHRRYECIVIEPKRLAEETGRWIMLGNILSRLSLLSGAASITISIVSPDRLFVSVPLAALTLITRGFYDISWNFDPCSKYQVESGSAVTRFVDESVAKSATRILVYKDNALLNYAQRSVTVVAVVLCGFHLYRSLK